MLFIVAYVALAAWIAALLGSLTGLFDVGRFNRDATLFVGVAMLFIAFVFSRRDHGRQ